MKPTDNLDKDFVVKGFPGVIYKIIDYSPSLHQYSLLVNGTSTYLEVDKFVEAHNLGNIIIIGDNKAPVEKPAEEPTNYFNFDDL